MRVGGALPAAVCLTLAVSCKAPTEPQPARDYRDDMARLIVDLGQHARRSTPGFELVLQNGHEVLFADGTAGSPPRPDVLAVVTGVARESLLYGYGGDDEPTPPGPRAEMQALAVGAHAAGLTVLTVDYCTTRAHVEGAYRESAALGFVPFAAPRRGLDVVPDYPQPPFAAHAGGVDSLRRARNFLYLINPGRFDGAGQLVAALAPTAYDLFIVDAFVDDDMLTAAQVAALQSKPEGGRRLVLAYLSIGEAEVYRDYFDPEWIVDPPAWLGAENPQWRGNFKVHYWEEDWRTILFGGPEAYLDRILAAGFDGVYLDIIDAFEYFESGGR